MSHFDVLTNVLAGSADREMTWQRVSQFDADFVVWSHNRLIELDDLLYRRWVELGRPHAELIK